MQKRAAVGTSSYGETAETVELQPHPDQTADVKIIVQPDRDGRTSASDTSESDTAQSVELTEDFTIWTSIAVGAATGGQVVVDERGTEADQITVSIPLAGGGSGRVFARLKVVKP